MSNIDNITQNNINLKYCLNVQPKTTILNNVVSYEKINMDKLDKLINSSLLLKSSKENNNKFVSYSFDNERKQLEAYKANYNKNKDGIKVKYIRPQKIQLGRVNPQKSLGLHSIRREIRHTLIDNNYIDIDIVNAHPVILYQICNKLNIKCKYLKEYVEQRQKYIDEFNKFYGFEGKEAFKKLILRLQYLGSYNKWLKENNFNERIKFIENFELEIKEICNNLIEFNKELYNNIEDYNKGKDKNIKASFMSFYLQNIENNILERLYKYLDCCGINNNVILSNDGLMILKENFESNILNDFNKLIKNNLDLDLNFIVKPFDQAYTDEQINNSQLIQEENIIFENLKNGGEKDIAELFYKIEDSYLYDLKNGWYEYDEYNKLIHYDKAPLNLKNKICETIRIYLNNEFSKIRQSNRYYNDYKIILEKFNNKLSSNSFCGGVVEFLQGLFNEPLKNKNIDEFIDNDINLVAFVNKVFDLSINDYRDIKRSDFILNHINFKAPDLNENIELNKYENEINEFIESIQYKENVGFLKRILGDSLFGNRKSLFYVFYNDGANGKGVLSTLMKNTLGGLYQTGSNQLLTSKFDGQQANPSLFDCKGRRVVMINEPEQNKYSKKLEFNPNFTKQITSGGEQITTRTLHKSNTTFKINFSLFVQTNELPDIDKIDGGFKRRLLTVKFPFKFVDNPKNKNEKLIDYSLKYKFEKIEYKKAFIKILLKNKNPNNKLDIPKNILDNTKEYFEDNNIVKHYIEEFLIKTDDPKDRIKPKILYEDYKNNGDGGLTKDQFHKEIKKMLNLSKIKGVRLFKGYRFKTFEEFEEDNNINVEEHKDQEEDNNINVEENKEQLINYKEEIEKLKIKLEEQEKNKKKTKIDKIKYDKKKDIKRDPLDIGTPIINSNEEEDKINSNEYYDVVESLEIFNNTPSKFIYLDKNEEKKEIEIEQELFKKMEEQKKEILKNPNKKKLTKQELKKRINMDKITKTKELKIVKKPKRN